MTRLAQLFVVAGMIGLCLGLFRGQILLAMLSLSSLLWVLSEWLLFLGQTRFQVPRLQPVRLVNGEREVNRSLWADSMIQVRCQLQQPIALYGVTFELFDVVPENLQLTASSVVRNPESKSWLIRTFFDFFRYAEKNPSNQFRLNSWRLPTSQADRHVSELHWDYSARVRAAGNVLFPGFRITIQSTHGLFRSVRFLKCEQSFRTLPSFVDAGEYQSLTKKSNVIPRHGIHRLARSGMGSELLELKEYAPGDPFKSIAWKISAKRDQWMTRQYESEVPARVQLFVDGSSSCRVGGFGFRLLDQMTFVAASIGRMAINAGDQVGGVLMDERGMRRLPPLSGEKGFQVLLRAISDFAVNPSPPPRQLTQRMMDAAWDLLSQRFPELLDFKINQFPFFVFPLLPNSRARRVQRFLIAGALAEINGLTIREHVALIHDDLAMARYIQALLNLAGIPWITPVVSSSERLDRDPIERLNQLSQSITTAVGHARDNEVFVVMSDLLNSIGFLEFLLPAVKLAVAKHHRVSFICPTTTFQRPSKSVKPNLAGDWSTDDLLLVAEQARLQIQSEQLRRELHRCGASLSLSGERNAIRMIMTELDAAKSGRSKFQGSLR